jgi:hypothetical protein
MDFDLDSITKQAGEYYDSAKKTATEAYDKYVDPAVSRLKAAGLYPGGGAPAGTNGAIPAIAFSGAEADWRVKVSLGKNADYFYKSNDPGILAPLKATNGVIFPYTPQVSVTHSARYGATNLTHSNYTNYSYEGSEVQAITLTGDFTVQNIEEGKYLLAAVYFFRAATKMFFGQGPHVGNPPPMVFLTGYGSHYFPNVSCVVTSFQHTMGADVDYMSIPTTGGAAPVQRDGGSNTNPMFTRVPTNSQLAVTLQPIYTRKNLYDKFNLSDFAAGKLINGNGGFL